MFVDIILTIDFPSFQTEFIVSSNMRYRFRLIHGGVCPLSISIASHPVILIAVDGSSVSPELTDALELVTGLYTGCLLVDFEFILQITFARSQGTAIFTIHRGGLYHCS